MQAIRRLALTLALFGASSWALAWEPPANPDPDVIVNEALADTAYGRFADAAQKHVWYHENAVRLKPEHAQIRLSVVLEEWMVLASKYPPALEDLKRMRNRAAERVNGLGPELVPAFTEVVRINEALGDPASTRDVYAELGRRDPPSAARLLLFALPALAAVGDHQTAFSYLQIDKVMEAVEGQLALSKKPAGINAEQRAQMQAQISRFVDLTLARVVWVLVQQKHPEAAQDLARRGNTLLEGADKAPLIAAALRGDALPATLN